MSLNLLDILHSVLCEGVSSQDIISAIQNKQKVIINYVDPEAHATKKRVIEPYVFGTSTHGHQLLRVYQYYGDTYRGNPKYKTLRVDRITSWEPTNDHFYEAPQDPYYRENGDKLMATIYCQATFDGDEDNDTFDYGNRLRNLRKKTQNMQNSTPINIKQLDDENKSGPIKNKTIDKASQEIKSTANDTEGDVKIERGPVDTSTIQTDDTTSTEATPTPSNQVEDDFQKMLARNLEITRQEKAKRGFDINKIRNQG